MSDLMSFKKNMEQLGMPFPSDPSMVGLQPGKATSRMLAEGDSITIKGTAALNTGTVNSPAGLQNYSLAQNATLIIGPFKGRQKIAITPLTGVIDVTVGGAVLGVTAVVDTGARLLNVSTNCSLPLNKAGSVTANSRSTHKIRGRVRGGLQFVIPNWYSVSGIETAPGAATTCTASLEYPLGTRYQATFNGLVQGIAANGGWRPSTGERLSHGSPVWRHSQSNLCQALLIAMSLTTENGAGLSSQPNHGVSP